MQNCATEPRAEKSKEMETKGKAMKYETYRLKATGCLFYFKVCTDERETVIYFVRSNAKGYVLGSLEIRAGEPMDKISAFIWCDRWVRSLLLFPFTFEDGLLKLEMEVFDER